MNQHCFPTLQRWKPVKIVLTRHGLQLKKIKIVFKEKVGIHGKKGGNEGWSEGGKREGRKGGYE